jgi:hypothetical protein
MVHETTGAKVGRSHSRDFGATNSRVSIVFFRFIAKLADSRSKFYS